MEYREHRNIPAAGHPADVIRPLALPENITLVQDMDAFAAQGDDATGPYPSGISVSPYFGVTAGGIRVPAYCTPVTLGGPHSFAMADLPPEGFPVEIEVTADTAPDSAAILPERHGVLPRVDGHTIRFRVTGYGQYTLVLNGRHEKPLTLILRDIPVLPDTEGCRVIRYGKGLHRVDFIHLPSDTILYLESGALLIPEQPDERETPLADPDWAGKKHYKPFIQAKDARHIKILGHGIVDFTGLDWHMRGPVSIAGCSGVEIDGITLINAPAWNLTATQCRDVSIRDVVIFGYRQNSDGINVVDSRDVRVEDCFIRSGDDLFGVKSLRRGEGCGVSNVRFDRCIAWPDKVRGFGVFHETVSDIRDVYFTECSVLYKYADWMDDLGSLVVISASEGNISRIFFRDIEIHFEIRYPIICSFIDDDLNRNPDHIFGSIRDIHFENIRYRGERRIRLKGRYDPAKLDDIHFKDIFRDGRKITSLEDLLLYPDGPVGSHLFLE